jgi:2-polyprenyl-6-methoxyphenol hydroxylase-like FAD-dependent oxidoreductase
MTPNLGQGACTAILDAEALTRAIAGHGTLPTALRAYDAERRRSAQRVAFASRTLHRIMSTERCGLRNSLLRLTPGLG